MSPHSRQVIFTLPFITLTLQFLPTSRGMLHLLQNIMSLGIGVLVLWPMRLASVTYLLALSSSPFSAAFLDRPNSIDMRLSAISDAPREEMRFLDISNASESPQTFEVYIIEHARVSLFRRLER